MHQCRRKLTQIDLAQRMNRATRAAQIEADKPFIYAIYNSTALTYSKPP